MNASRLARASRLAGHLERPFVTVALFLFAGGMISQLQKWAGSNRGPVQGDPALQILYAGIYLVTFFLLVQRSGEAVRLAASSPIVWALVGLAAISFLWSGFPYVTLRRSAALIGGTAFGLYLAVRFKPAEQLHILEMVFGAAAVLSLAFALLLPAEGLMVERFEGSWRGIFGHKNALGQVMVLGAVVFAYNVRQQSSSRSWRLALLGLSLVMVVLSQSWTAAAALIALSALFLLLTVLKLEPGIAAVLLLVAIVLAFAGPLWVGANPSTVNSWFSQQLAALGKADSLTGRTDLWAAVLHMIRQRPLLGYGYGSFWLGTEGPSQHVFPEIPWVPTHAHNGFLDLWLELGLIGALVFGSASAHGLLRVASHPSADRLKHVLWPLLLLAALTLFNLTGSDLVKRNEISWILYVAAMHQLGGWSAHKRDDTDAPT
jgi:O-antigen ligase